MLRSHAHNCRSALSTADERCARAAGCSGRFGLPGDVRVQGQRRRPRCSTFYLGGPRQQPRANCPRIRTDTARSLRIGSLLFCNAASSSFAVKRAESCVEFFSTACTAVLAGVLLFWICRFAVSAAAFCCVRFVHVPTVSVSNCRTVLVLVRD